MRFAERPDGRDYLASMGIYVFRKQFLVDLLTESAAIDFGKDIIPQAVNTPRVGLSIRRVLGRHRNHTDVL